MVFIETICSWYCKVTIITLDHNMVCWLYVLLIVAGHGIHETTEDGESLLSLACSAGYYELAEVLLRMRASVEDRGIKGKPSMKNENEQVLEHYTVQVMIDNGRLESLCNNLICEKGYFCSWECWTHACNQLAVSRKNEEQWLWIFFIQQAEQSSIINRNVH